MPKIARNSYDWFNPYDPKFSGLFIDPKTFNTMLREYGVRVRHEKAMACPNYKGNIDSGNHSLDCPVCHGEGFIYYPGGEFHGLFQSNTLQRRFSTEGYLDPGTALLTTPSMLEDLYTYVYLHYFDRITLLDFEDRYNELKHRGEGNVDLLKYDALKVEYLSTNDVQYEEGKDFELDENGNIRWTTSNRPGKNQVPKYGEIYTISYLYKPVYRIVHMLHEGRFSQNKLKSSNAIPRRFAQQVILKKDFLMEKKDFQTGDVLKEPVVP